MKKNLLTGVLALAILMGTSVYAQTNCDYSCSEPQNLTSKTSRFFSNATGQNFLAEKIAQRIIKKQINKAVNGDVNVYLNSYSVRDLKQGKFQTLNISGRNVDIEGVYLTAFEVKTLCNYNYLEVDKKGKVAIKENMPLAISVDINEADLNKTMKSKDYERMLDDINGIGGSFNIFKIESTQVKIKNNKLFYIMKIAIPFVRGTQDVVLTANLQVKDGKIVFVNTELVNKNICVDLSKMAKALNYINPLDFSVKILENKNANISIQNVDLKDGMVSVSARMLVLKDTVTQ